ncbi:hypothetical protein NIES2104_23140 [Leptolyngbya sp. NIES-2104]|nr:hypothetical protein NIES2104_23140 [Leptolyngbya sp. NIES-2104]
MPGLVCAKADQPNSVDRFSNVSVPLPGLVCAKVFTTPEILMPYR